MWFYKYFLKKLYIKISEIQVKKRLNIKYKNNLENIITFI